MIVDTAIKLVTSTCMYQFQTLTIEKEELANEVKHLQKVQHDMAKAWDKQLRICCATKPTMVC